MSTLTRIAEEIWRAKFNRLGGPMLYTISDQDWSLAAARAVLELMRKPTDQELGIHPAMDVDVAKTIRWDFDRVICNILADAKNHT